MKTLIHFFSFLFLLNLLACTGGGGATAEDNQTADTETPDDIAGAIKQAQEVIAQTSQLQEGEPLNFRALQEFLPEKLNGLKRTAKSGQTNGAMGFKISQAEGKYETKSGSSIKIDVVDTGGLKMGLMSMAAWANLDIDREDDKGYERSTTLNGFKAFEKYTKRNNKSELSLLVNSRFVVKAEGREVDMKELKAVIGDMPLGKMK